MDDIAPRPLLDGKDLAVAIDHAESLALAGSWGLRPLRLAGTLI